MEKLTWIDETGKGNYLHSGIFEIRQRDTGYMLYDEKIAVNLYATIDMAKLAADAIVSDSNNR